jgi:hypothetical protein
MSFSLFTVFNESNLMSEFHTCTVMAVHNCNRPIFRPFVPLWRYVKKCVKEDVYFWQYTVRIILTPTQLWWYGLEHCHIKMCTSGRTVLENINNYCQNCTSVAFFECLTVRIAHATYLCNFAGNEGIE